MAPTRVRLSREDLLDRSGVDDDLLTALLKAGVITTGPGGFFDEHAVVILQCAQALADYGVEPRHLRAFRSAADRQSDLIAQIAGPLVKAGKPVPVTAPTTWLARSLPLRSRFTPR